MQAPNLVLFYVRDPLESATFYQKLFGQEPSAVFPTYVAFAFPNGFTFSLWSTSAKNFLSRGTGNTSELAFIVSGDEEVRQVREQWGKLDVPIEQDLEHAVFGLTFVALDPDGHRIRVCGPDE